MLGKLAGTFLGDSPSGDAFFSLDKRFSLDFFTSIEGYSGG
jgi:hypothetical protein